MFNILKELFSSSKPRSQRMVFGTNITLNENVLSCQIHAGENEVGIKAKYFFYLVKNGSTIAKHGWSDISSHRWTLTETGNYRVRGFIEIGGEKRNSFSDGVDFFNAEFEQSWAQLKSGDMSAINSLLDLNFVDADYPHQSFLLVQTMNGPVPTIPLSLRHEYLKTDHCSALYSSLGSAKFDGVKAVFSGNAFVDGRLIYGQDDIGDCNKLDMLAAYGDFSAVIVGQDQITVSNDYFGVQKIYYLESAQGLLISNRHHLVVIAAVALGFNLRINKAVALSHLVSGITQPFQQTLSSDSLVQGVKILPVHNRLVVRGNAMHLENKPVARILTSKRRDISPAEYVDLLKKGGKDVVANLQAIFDHPRFKHVLVDLSGGMDSRAVYSALTNVNGGREKTRINSCDTASLPDDQKIALTINNAFGYQYDDIDEEVTQCSNLDLLHECFSHLAGVYYAYDPTNTYCQTISLKDTINVTGFFGEICLRPYYSRSYLESLAGLELHEFVEQLLGQHSLSSFGGASALAQLKSVMLDGLAALPGESALEKYDLHYLYFRNGLHCSDIYRFNKKTPRIGVLQSAYLMDLKLNTYGKVSVVKLENDFIACLNPLLACFPYDTKRDNADKAAAQSELEVFDPRLNGVKFPINADNQAWLAARAAKQRVILGKLEDKSRHDIDAVALQAVKELMKYPEVVDEAVLKAVFAQLKTQGSNYVLVNKVISLCQHVRMLQQAG
ncbi:hypothetical protein [Rheinheimera maricola]|uniref:Asparagine synthase n=1 Tax=Rheinheimera maricola TaxID=2793282 RepID=A0ABS7X488_9GAMM|nr:hypothetical protein [Rheinheimera maricola]MBZ9610359.1 hypothetical protein [Rheinheimera maricola]